LYKFRVHGNLFRENRHLKNTSSEQQQQQNEQNEKKNSLLKTVVEKVQERVQQYSNEN
jgi:hypothetical protein